MTPSCKLLHVFHERMNQVLPHMKNTQRTRLLVLRLVALLVFSVLLTAPLAREQSDPSDPKERNMRPVIGAFSQNIDTVTDSNTIDLAVEKSLWANSHLIPASHANWIGQAGGRTLSILLDQPEKYDQKVRVFCRTEEAHYGPSEVAR